jgi:hypothetical protein
VRLALDTNAYSTAARGEAKAVALVRAADRLTLPFVVPADQRHLDRRLGRAARPRPPHRRRAFLESCAAREGVKVDHAPIGRAFTELPGCDIEVMVADPRTALLTGARPMDATQGIVWRSDLYSSRASHARGRKWGLRGMVNAAYGAGRVAHVRAWRDDKETDIGSHRWACCWRLN